MKKGSSVSIRLKMIVGIVVVFVLGIASLGFFLQQSFNARVTEAAQTALRNSTTAFTHLENAEADKLSATLIGLESNAAFRDPFLAGDREGLSAAAQPVFAALKAEYRITHWYFESLPESSTVFLRVHRPEQFGDELNRKTYLAASKDETQSAGLELGKTAVALRVVRPYYGADDKLIGYMELGQEIDGFLGDIKEETGDEVGLLLAKKSMDSSGWADVAKKNGGRDNWGDQENFVLAGSTSEELSEEIVKTKGLESIGAEGKVLGVFKKAGGVTGTRAAFPINDAAGEPIGLVVVEHDITAVVDEISSTRIRMMGAIITMMVVVLGVVIALMNILVFSRLNHMITDMETLSTRVAGGDYDVSYTPTGANDEIGQFERFYADFITMVGAALKQLSDAMKR